jgi:uncharacterized membrane protein
MNTLKIWQGMAIIGLIGLILLIILWNGWLTPVQTIPRSIEMLIMLAPLLLFLRGTLHGRYNTHVIITFPAMFYLLIGFWYVFTPQEEIYGYLMMLFSLLLYTGGFMYARTIMKRDKAQAARKEAQKVS